MDTISKDSPANLSEIMQEIIARKKERRRLLAALPVGEKLRMLEEMLEDTRAISATRPPPPGTNTPPPKEGVSKN
jgi:hypothetical protein